MMESIGLSAETVRALSDYAPLTGLFLSQVNRGPQASPFHHNLQSDLSSPSGEPDGRRHASQPCVPVAAVTISEPARFANPPGVPLTASASSDVAALSSVLPSAGDRQAVAAIGFALVATADRVLMNSITLRVVAASASAENSKSISARS
ncbi:hypothetical protein ACVWZK_006437 [Bradyrhizobium sp. GM0.4]